MTQFHKPSPLTLRLVPVLGLSIGLLPLWLRAEELPIMPNVPMSEFQNRSDYVPSYNFDSPPQGMFRTITLARGFEEEMAFRRSHEVVPVNPTEVFAPDAPAVFIVFSLHQHYQAFQVFGLCFPEQVNGLDPKTVLTQDVMYVALEDDSGYVELTRPPGGWKPGKYKVEIHVGYQVNEISLIGTMRFTVAQAGGEGREAAGVQPRGENPGAAGAR